MLEICISVLNLVFSEPIVSFQYFETHFFLSLEKIESRKATLIAEMTAEFAKEENKITSQFDSDPLLKLKSREVDLRAMENERKAKEAEERINLDKARTMMDQEFKEEKLEQNEKLAKLRAGVSLAKSGAGNTIIGIDD